MLLSFFELPEEDRPPERIWLNPKRLVDHWDVVRARREAKSKGMEPLDSGGSYEMQNPTTANWR